MAWRAADSLSLRQFLDIALHEAPPDHSTVSRTRRPIDVETHEAVFTWVLQRVARRRLAQGVDGRHRRDDAGSERGAAEHRSSGHGRRLRRVPARTSGGVRHSDADPGRVGPPRPEGTEEKLERRLVRIHRTRRSSEGPPAQTKIQVRRWQSRTAAAGTAGNDTEAVGRRSSASPADGAP